MLHFPFLLNFVLNRHSFKLDRLCTPYCMFHNPLKNSFSGIHLETNSKIGTEIHLEFSLEINSKIHSENGYTKCLMP